MKPTKYLGMDIHRATISVGVILWDARFEGDYQSMSLVSTENEPSGKEQPNRAKPLDQIEATYERPWAGSQNFFLTSLFMEFVFYGTR